MVNFSNFIVYVLEPEQEVGDLEHGHVYALALTEKMKNVIHVLLDRVCKLLGNSLCLPTALFPPVINLYAPSFKSVTNIK